MCARWTKTHVAVSILVIGVLLAPAWSWAQGVLFVEGNKVGIGTSSPETDLDIQSQTNNANVLQARSTKGHQLFRVFETTNGDGLVSLFNELGEETFRFTSVLGGRLAIGCISALTHKLEINNGNGPGRACGTGTFSRVQAGDTQFSTSSSRSSKENIVPLHPEGILEKVAAIGVYSYDFIDGPKDRMGLMAEDFHEVFGRGPREQLNGHDVQMALWLAVQEVATRNQELAGRLEALVEQNDALAQEVRSLRAMPTGAE